jgi:general secretion pathway protein K
MTAHTAASPRGFALLIVLWTMGLLALLIGGLAAEGRSDLGVAGNVRDGATAEAAADGGIQQAIFQLHLGVWPADGTAHQTVIGAAIVRVTIEDMSMRINPNLSSPPMLTALLEAIGADPAQALNLARAMLDWRTATPVSQAGGLKIDRYRRAGLPYAGVRSPAWMKSARCWV